MNKFEDLSGRIANLGTMMRHRYKFRDRRWTLLNLKHTRHEDLIGPQKTEGLRAREECDCFLPYATEG